MRGLFAAALFALVAVAPAVAEETGGTLAKIAEFRHDRPRLSPKFPAFLVPRQGRPASRLLYRSLPAGCRCSKAAIARPDLIVKFVPVDADDRLQKVADGSIDIECGNTTNTLTRQEQVDFTNTIFITGASLLLPAASAVQGVSDLTGKKVAVVEGTTTEKALRERLAAQSVDARVIPVADHDKAMKMLAKGEIDAHAGDQIVLIGLAHAADDPSMFVVAPELFTYEPYALVVRRNDADFRLVANRTLAQLFRSGEIMQVFDKWFAAWGGRPSRLLLAVYALNGLPE